MQGNVTLTDAIIVGARGVQMRGQDVALSAPTSPATYPAVISGSSVNVERGVEVHGPIAADVNGMIELFGASVHGPLVGGDVVLKDAAAWVTDDDNPDAYGLMPGFFYPDELKSTIMVPGTWRELQ